MKKIIILGAGIPHVKKNPSILFKIFKNHNTLDFIREKFQKYSKNITLVTGYKSHKINKNQEIQIIKNHNWKNTKSFGSLLLNDLTQLDEVIIVYSDIFFDEGLIDTLIKSKSDVTFFYSSQKLQNPYKENVLIKKKKIS